MNDFKELWYDWQGKNDTLFLQINHYRETDYNTAMQYISWVGDKSHFQGYFVGLLVIAVLASLFSSLRGKKAWPYIMSWIGVFAVLIIGFYVNDYITLHLKDYFSYPRPYISYVSGSEMYKMENIDKAKDFQSFPSGHTTFVTFMVMALWPVLGNFMKACGIALIFLTAWSRVSLGMHYPADVVGAVIIAVPLIWLLRIAIYAALRKIKIRC